MKLVGGGRDYWVVGVAGAFIGGYLNVLLELGDYGILCAFCMAVIGAIVLLMMYAAY
jgi:uncharacterized membrane protein YeaQ/YmgE (transglycosylase-associated protein family)